MLPVVDFLLKYNIFGFFVCLFDESFLIDICQCRGFLEFDTAVFRTAVSLPVSREKKGWKLIH